MRRKLKIDSLDKLEQFIDNQSISIEARLNVFQEALKAYPLFILHIKFDEEKIKIEDPEKVFREMKRLLKEIKETDKLHYTGFVVLFENTKIN